MENTAPNRLITVIGFLHFRSHRCIEGTTAEKTMTQLIAVHSTGCMGELTSPLMKSFYVFFSISKGLWLSRAANVKSMTNFISQKTAALENINNFVAILNSPTNFLQNALSTLVWLICLCLLGKLCPCFSFYRQPLVS